MDDPPLHPDVEPLAFLLGTWVGEGTGEYPTIQPFGDREEARFWHLGKPYLSYAQRAWRLDDGVPSHGETGFWRPGGPGRVEVVMAHPNGMVDVEEGTVEGTTIELATTSVGRTSTAKEYTSLSRSLTVDGDVLTYRLSMAVVGRPLAVHLEAVLRKQ